MNTGRIVNPFKMEKTCKKILDLMESEKLNEAEAESMPAYLGDSIKKNSELHSKGKAFTVFKDDYSDKSSKNSL